MEPLGLPTSEIPQVISFKTVMLWGLCGKRTPRIFSSPLASMSRQAKKKEKKKNEHINKSIQGRDVSKGADSTVGNQRVRRPACQSGEHRSDGLFLDESATGWDASTTSPILLLLGKTSRQGRTSLFSMYQPRCIIFKLLGDLTLPALGKALF